MSIDLHSMSRTSSTNATRVAASARRGPDSALEVQCQLFVEHQAKDGTENRGRTAPCLQTGRPDVNLRTTPPSRPVKRQRSVQNSTLHCSYLGLECPEMPRANTDRRRRVPPVVVAVVQPVTKRLSRMEALLIEMRHEQDVKLKRITGLQEQVDTLSEHVTVISTIMRRISRDVSRVLWKKKNGVTSC